MDIQHATIPLENPLLILLTGGPGAGKTSLCERLSARGFITVPESGRAVIRRHGKRPDASDFGRAMLDLDLANYHQHRDSRVPVIFDRGLPDLAAFVVAQRVADAAGYHEAILQFRYHQIAFILPPWQEIYSNDAERDQTFTQSVEVHDRIESAYRVSGYDLIVVGKASIEERCRFIVGHIARWRANRL